MCVCSLECRFLWNPEGGSRCPGAVDTQCGCWKWNSGAGQEQSKLLTTETPSVLYAFYKGIGKGYLGHGSHDHPLIFISAVSQNFRMQILKQFSPYFLRQGLLLNLELTDWLDCWILCSPPSGAEVVDFIMPSLGFYLSARDGPQVLILAWQTLFTESSLCLYESIFYPEGGVHPRVPCTPLTWNP